MKADITILIFLCNLALISAQSECCRGQNIVLLNNKCSNGDDVKKLSCDSRIVMVANSSGATVDEKDNLVFSDYDDILSPDEYCFTKMQKDDTDVYILCYEEDTHYTEIMTINVILSFISVVFIFLTIVVYLSVPQLLDLQGICLVHAISGLAFSFIILGIIDLSEFISQQTCHLLAYLMYSSFMYAFFWLNIVCFHIWKMIVKPRLLRFTKRWLLIYHLFGIGGPFILLVFVLMANYSGLDYFEHIHPGIGEVKCWFKTPSLTLLYFYSPISILLCINIIYFIWTIIVLWRDMKKCSEKKTKVLKYRLLLCIKLFFIMGITWCFEVISAVLEKSTSRWIWVVPDALNALQGLLIFLLLVVFRKKAVRALANKKLFRSVRLPANWKHAQDDECEELEEEISLSGIEQKKPEISL